jgi:uncharacterized protein
MVPDVITSGSGIQREKWSMTVEVRYLVVRDGKEVAMYLTKKEADEHDKMLDIASAIAGFIQQAESLALDEDTLEELSIYLSKNREELMRLLKGVKPGMPDNSPSAPIAEAPQKARRGRTASQNKEE